MYMHTSMHVYVQKIFLIIILGLSHINICISRDIYAQRSVHLFIFTYIISRAIKQITSMTAEDIMQANDKAEAYASLMNDQNKEARKEASIAKMTLTKNLNRIKKIEGEAIILANNNKEILEKMSLLKIALFDQLLSNLKVIKKFNQHECMRRILTVILSLILIPESTRNSIKIQKFTIYNLLGLNSRSLLVKYCFDKAEKLEIATVMNDGTKTLLMIENAVIPIERSDRSDKLPEHDKKLAQIYWKAMTVVSPNAKDLLKREISPGVIEEQMIQRQFHSDRYIWDHFLTDVKIKMGETIFVDCKPWYVRPGKDDTCLCVGCEDFRLAKQAVVYNMDLLDKPYLASRVLNRFLFAAFTALLLMKKKN